MSMTISIDNLRTALRDTNAKAAVAFADAEKLKDGMIAAGVDPTEGEHFEKVDTAYKGYSVLADEAAQIEANCALPSGEHIGRPFRLMPWQKEWVNELYACDAKGDLRYRWSLLGIPRKNGKSTRIAVLALYRLMADPGGRLPITWWKWPGSAAILRTGGAVPQVRVHNFAVSLDGFGTGEGLTLEAPFGHAGQRLHEWMIATRFWRSTVGEAGGGVGIDNAFAERHGPNIGAEIMGRGKFGPPQGGPWTGLGTDEEWRGWWGPNPPFHTPVFVLTHHPRPSIEMEGGTVFHFVDASPQEALRLARQAAGDLDVRIGGGPSTVRQFLAAGLIDVLHIVQVPVLLGRGVRLWDGLEGIEERFDVEAVSSPSGVTHLTFTRR